jgi:GTPase SAR1 family protein
VDLTAFQRSRNLTLVEASEHAQRGLRYSIIVYSSTKLKRRDSGIPNWLHQLKVGVRLADVECKPQYHHRNTAVEREDVSTLPCLTAPSQSNLPLHVGQII